MDTMDDMFNLNKHIMQVVDKQIEDEYPPVTRQTYERLLAAGDDEISAKEKIAAVIAEEIYLMLKQEYKIDEKVFAERLSKIE